MAACTDSALAGPPQELPERLESLRERVGPGLWVDWRCLKQLEEVQETQAATTFKCLYTPQQGGPSEVLALQMIKSKLGHKSDTDSKYVSNYDELLVQEAKLHSTLQHRFVVQLHGCGWTQEAEEDESVHGGHYFAREQRGERPPRDGHQLFLLTDLMEGGTLHALVVQAMLKDGERTWYSDKLALRWALQLAMALEYLHTRSPKVIHLNVKLENCLLTHSKLSKASLKLGDFKLASRRPSQRVIAVGPTEAAGQGQDCELSSMGAAETGEQAATERQGTFGRRQDMLEEVAEPAGSLSYMAPEIFLRQPYDEKVDVFSFAIVLWNLFHREIPTANILMNGSIDDLETYAFQVAHGFRQPLSPNVPREVRSLIERCWQADPSRRPTMSAVVQELAALQPPLPPDDPTSDAGTGSGNACCTVM